jgi:hypothetical protein
MTIVDAVVGSHILSFATQVPDALRIINPDTTLFSFISLT